MSLHTVAKHMAAKGRGPDDQLIHMSRNEVAGLQALAKAHGGSLTINPETGLAEAGFLDKLLPTIVGAGIGAATGNPWLAAAIMGGGTYLNTGDLGKGLMAGLGGYGAGSMGAGLATLGGGELAADTGRAASAMGMGPEEVLAAQTEAQGSTLGNLGKGLSTAWKDPKLGMAAMGGWGNIGMAAAPAITGMLTSQKPQAPQGTATQMIRPYTFDYKDTVASGKLQPKDMIGAKYTPGQDTSERTWFEPTYTALTPYKAAEGGLMSLANGGTIEQMSNNNAIGSNTGYPQADIKQVTYASPYQTPVPQNVIAGAQDVSVDPYTGEESRFAPAQASRFDEGGLTDEEKAAQERAMQELSGGSGVAALAAPNQQTGLMQEILNPTLQQMNLSDADKAQWQKIFDAGNSVVSRAAGPFAHSLPTDFRNTNTQGGGMAAGGGISTLGGYSDGGRLLKGPGDGMSDSIPAQIGSKQPARLADGEFVVPADVVSHLGNGSTDAGAKQLYKMMDRIRSQRTGKRKQAPQVNPNKAMPA